MAMLLWVTDGEFPSCRKFEVSDVGVGPRGVGFVLSPSPIPELGWVLPC